MKRKGCFKPGNDDLSEQPMKIRIFKTLDKGFGKGLNLGLSLVYPILCMLGKLVMRKGHRMTTFAETSSLEGIRPEHFGLGLNLGLSNQNRRTMLAGFLEKIYSWIINHPESVSIKSFG